jgi:Domain of unknown function (DUF4189)
MRRWGINDFIQIPKQHDVRALAASLALGLAGIILAAHGASGEGALAVGTSGNVAKDGIAIGAGINKPTKDAAVEQALKTCREFKGAPKMAKLCKIVTTFTRECYATAYDPKPGTPGTGWAFGPDKPTAEARAKSACEETAGAGRREFCAVSQSYCDEHD